jgi:HSP20 family protein
MELFDESMFFGDVLDWMFESHRPYGRSESGFVVRRIFQPAADVIETQSSIIVKLEVPGVDYEDIQVNMEGSNLVISGKREFDRDAQSEELVRLERGFGDFKRIFHMPEEIDSSTIKAKLDSGVLTITIPSERPRRTIPVESGGRFE